MKSVIVCMNFKNKAIYKLSYFFNLMAIKYKISQQVALSKKHFIKFKISSEDLGELNRSA